MSKSLTDYIRGNCVPVYELIRVDKYSIASEGFKRCYILRNNDVIEVVSNASPAYEDLYHLYLELINNRDDKEHIKELIKDNRAFKYFCSVIKQKENFEIVL